MPEAAQSPVQPTSSSQTSPVVPESVAPASPQAPSPPPTTPKKSKRKWIFFAAVLALVIVGIIGAYYLVNVFKNSATSSPETSSEKLVRIGLSLDTIKIQRWPDERDIMVEKGKSMNATVTTLVAEDDDEVQISHIENFITQKMDVIIVVAHDADALGPVITKAQKNGIKVINYDRLTRGGTPDLYLSFDSVKVGEIEAKYVVDEVFRNASESAIANIAYIAGSPTDNNAHLLSEGVMKVLDPLIKEGKVNLVYNEFTKDWSPSEAYSNFKMFLDEGGKVDGVVAANDGTAYGAIQALEEFSLDGKVPVSGQDGELQAIQRIIKGTQLVTAYKPGRLLAEKAVESAVDFANGRKPEANGIINNETADIQAFLFDPIPVTKENIDDTVIKDGKFTRDQIYNTTSDQLIKPTIHE